MLWLLYLGKLSSNKKQKSTTVATEGYHIPKQKNDYCWFDTIYKIGWDMSEFCFDWAHVGFGALDCPADNTKITAFLLQKVDHRTLQWLVEQKKQATDWC